MFYGSFSFMIDSFMIKINFSLNHTRVMKQQNRINFIISFFILTKNKLNVIKYNLTILIFRMLWYI